MYLSFYGLRERPFDLTPNPRYVLLTPRHTEALSTLQYGIESRKGIVALTGEAGTGKTTLLRAALSNVDDTGWVVSVNNPKLTRDEFLEFLAEGFGLSGEAAQSKARFVRDFEQALRDRYETGAPCVLVVDEAQCLSDELLEEVRLLANIETEETKLLSVVLAGQPELSARLSDTELRQLKQRIALRCALTALDIRETAAYIAGRIRVAGGEAARVFSREAVQLIHQAARGIPRSINVLCDNALVSGYAADERPVGVALVREVCNDLDLHAQGSTQPHTGAQDGAAGPGQPTRTKVEARTDASAPVEAAETEPMSAAATGGRPALFAVPAVRRRFLFFS
jgi:general secretion pathway protein A